MKHRLLMAATVLLAMLALAALPAAAQTYPEDTITVMGSGQASGTPDLADINVGVRTISEDVSTAFEQNNAQVQAVINTLTNMGVAREDIRTTSIYTSFRNNTPPAPGGQPQPERTYEVTNDLRITVRDTSRIGELIAAAVEAGANNVYGLNFRFSNQDTLEQQARVEAMSDARTQAEQLAGIADVSLGEIVVINETPGGFSPAPFAMAGMGGGGGGGGAPIEPGQLTVSVQVQVTYRIVR
jgi:hypothetical protein